MGAENHLRRERVAVPTGFARGFRGPDNQGKPNLPNGIASAAVPAPHPSLRSLGTLVAAALALLGACAPDVVEPNGYVRDGGAGPGGAGPGAAGTTGGQGTGGTSGASGASGSAGSPDAAAGETRPLGGSSDGGPSAGSGECDLSGRWLVAQRVLAVAIGQEQAAQSWFYWEASQDASGSVTLKKGLHCGFTVVKKTGLAASVDSSGAWPSLLTRNSSSGRRGRFVREGAGCRLSMDKEYVVRGATLPHYGDPAQKLPNRMEKAEAGKPGWEDWDGDGQPGISLKVSSTLASGTLHTCQRDFTVYDGMTAAGASKLRVGVTYGGEQVPLGRSAGSAQAIESSSSPSSDPKQHFAILHRLTAEQAVGDDAAICEAIRSLRTTLAPEAGQ